MDRRGKNRRRAPRILHADLLGYSDRRKDGLYHLLGTGRTLDLSETGLRMRTHEPMPLGKILDFELKVGELTHRFRGRVVWCDEVEQDKRYEAGVRFESVDFGLAKSLWELTGDAGSHDAIKLHDDSGDLHAVAAEPVQFSPLSNRPLASDDSAERQLVRHLVGRNAGEGDAAPLEELLRRALANTPQGGFSSPGDLRDALARAAASLAQKAEKEASGVTEALGAPVPPSGPSRSSGTLPAIKPGGPPSPARGVPAIKAGRMTPPPRPGGMAGHFKGDQLVEFVQMLGLTRRSGLLEVVARQLSGHLAFRDGRFVAASLADGQKGEAAIFALLGQQQGDFRFRPDLPPGLVAENDLAVEAILLEVARRRDEASSNESSQERPS